MSECARCGKCCIEMAGDISLEADDCMLVLASIGVLARRLESLDEGSEEHKRLQETILDILGGVAFPMPMMCEGEDEPAIELLLDEVVHEDFRCECGSMVTLMDDWKEDKEAYECPGCHRLITDHVLSHCAWFDPGTSLCKYHKIRPKMCRDYPTTDHNYTCLNDVTFSPGHD